jgi:hypothetical protein
MNEQDVIRLIEEEIARRGSLRATARLWSVSPAYLSHLVARRMRPGYKVLSPLGLVRIVTYEYRHSEGMEMRKREELVHPSGCLAKAGDDEMLFILLGRDVAAPVAIRAWIGERLRLGMNRPSDRKIVEAEQCARIMEAEGMPSPPHP